MLRKVLGLVISFTMFIEQAGFAQLISNPDMSGMLSGVFARQASFRPLHFRSLFFNASTNDFQVFVDKGDAKPTAEAIKTGSGKLFEYFLTGLSLPNSTFWVNLRPDSPDNVIDPLLGKTDVGKVLLEADLQLKKDLASFTSPDGVLGKEYWTKLYAKAQTVYGASNITIPTISRPWIVPGEIILCESPTGAYIYKAVLKVMLEQDYLKDNSGYSFSDSRQKEINEYSAQMIRTVILPKLNKEINSSKRYASLRQVYYSLIMAQWFKKHFNTSASGSYSTLIDSKNLTGLTSATSWSKDSYYQSYKDSFERGEYNKQETIANNGTTSVRRYCSGGLNIIDIGKAVQVVQAPLDPVTSAMFGPDLAEETFNGQVTTLLRESLPEPVIKDGGSAYNLPLGPSDFGNLIAERVGRGLMGSYDFPTGKIEIVKKEIKRACLAGKAATLMSEVDSFQGLEGWEKSMVRPYVYRALFQSDGGTAWFSDGADERIARARAIANGIEWNETRGRRDLSPQRKAEIWGWAKDQADNEYYGRDGGSEDEYEINLEKEKARAALNDIYGRLNRLNIPLSDAPIATLDEIHRLYGIINADSRKDGGFIDALFLRGKIKEVREVLISYRDEYEKAYESVSLEQMRDWYNQKVTSTVQNFIKQFDGSYSKAVKAVIDEWNRESDEFGRLTGWAIPYKSYYPNEFIKTVMEQIVQQWDEQERQIEHRRLREETEKRYAQVQSEQAGYQIEGSAAVLSASKEKNELLEAYASLLELVKKGDTRAMEAIIAYLSIKTYTTKLQWSYTCKAEELLPEIIKKIDFLTPIEKRYPRKLYTALWELVKDSNQNLETMMRVYFIKTIPRVEFARHASKDLFKHREEMVLKIILDSGILKDGGMALEMTPDESESIAASVEKSLRANAKFPRWRIPPLIFNLKEARTTDDILLAVEDYYLLAPEDMVVVKSILVKVLANLDKNPSRSAAIPALLGELEKSRGVIFKDGGRTSREIFAENDRRVREIYRQLKATEMRNQRLSEIAGDDLTESERSTLYERARGMVYGDSMASDGGAATEQQVRAVMGKAIAARMQMLEVESSDYSYAAAVRKDPEFQESTAREIVALGPGAIPLLEKIIRTAPVDERFCYERALELLRKNQATKDGGMWATWQRHPASDFLYEIKTIKENRYSDMSMYYEKILKIMTAPGSKYIGQHILSNLEPLAWLEENKPGEFYPAVWELLQYTAQGDYTCLTIAFREYFVKKESRVKFVQSRMAEMKPWDRAKFDEQLAAAKLLQTGLPGIKEMLQQQDRVDKLIFNLYDEHWDSGRDWQDRGGERSVYSENAMKYMVDQLRELGPEYNDELYRHWAYLKQQGELKGWRSYLNAALTTVINERFGAQALEEVRSMAADGGGVETKIEKAVEDAATVDPDWTQALEEATAADGAVPTPPVGGVDMASLSAVTMKMNQLPGLTGTMAVDLGMLKQQWSQLRKQLRLGKAPVDELSVYVKTIKTGTGTEGLLAVCMYHVAAFLRNQEQAGIMEPTPPGMKQLLASLLN